MIAVLLRAVLILAIGLGASASQAMSPIDFFQGGSAFTGGTGGTGGSTFDLTFTLDASTQDLTDVAITVAFRTFDHNYLVDVNYDGFGNLEEVPVDPNNPIAFSPTIATPWTANVNGLSRAILTMSQAGVTFRGSRTTTASTLVSVTYPLATNAPVFRDGLNVIRIQNPDGAGPDGIDFSITGSVPEPSSFALVGLGLIGLAITGRRR